ncbi:MAG: PTS transporter subunit EIIC, partial [Bacilli bacterium]|nr:PTS transporter subunit EIIC [Bacilli bacterium]
MNEKELGVKLIELLGGVDNLNSVYNCYTRVRAEVKNVEIVDVEAIKKIPGLIGVVVAGQQIQIIVGLGKCVKCAQAMREYIEKNKDPNLKGSTVKSEKEQFKKEYLGNKDEFRKKKSNPFFKKVSGIFVPIIPAFIACGLLLAILEVINVQMSSFGDTTAGVIFEILANSVFSVLSVIVGYNACREFGGDGIIGGCLAAVMTSPLLGTINDPIIQYGSLKIYSGLGGVISVILVAVATGYLERLLRKFMPNAIDAFVTPLISLAVMTLAALFVFMPIGGYVSLGIEITVTAILESAPFLIGIVPMFYLIMVLFGVHHVLIPISQTLIDMTAVDGKPGYSILVAVQLMAGAAEIGAAIYFLITSKNKKMKKIVAGSIPIGVLGIDEPLIWGLSFPLKRLFIPIGIAGGISGGVLAVLLYNLSSGSLAPETTGIEAALLMSTNTAKWVYALTFIGAIVLGFIFTALIGYKEVVEVVDDKTGKVTEIVNETSLIAKYWGPFKKTKPYSVLAKIASPFKKFGLLIARPFKKKAKAKPVDETIVVSPFNGEVIDLSSLKDKTFSQKVMGDGVAIIPKEGKIYAPVSGTISA